MARLVTIPLLACAIATCADDDPGPIAFAEQCGVTGPMRLVATTPDQSVSFRSSGDRIYYSRNDLDSDGQWIAGPRAVESIGPCGESPRHIADDLADAPFTLEQWPDALFGCVAGSGLVSLDPEGVQPPHLVIPTANPDCALTFTPHGILDVEVHDDGVIDVLLRSIPADPRQGSSETELLLTLPDAASLRFAGDAVYYLDPDQTLVRLALSDRDPIAIQTHVHDYQLSGGERYLLWQDATATNGDPDDPTGIVSLRDSSSGNSVALGGALDKLGQYSLQWIERGVIYDHGGDRYRMVFLPDLDFIDLPANGYLTGPATDDLWLIERPYAPSISVLDIRDRTITPLFTADSQIVGGDADSLLVHALAPCCGLVTVTDEAPVWRVPLDGSRARVVADRAAMFTVSSIDDTRMLVGVDVTDDRRETLLLVDTTTRAEQLVDHDVTGRSRPPDDPTLLTYTVRDGDRSGLWRVRLPPAP